MDTPVKPDYDKLANYVALLMNVLVIKFKLLSVKYSPKQLMGCGVEGTRYFLELSLMWTSLYICKSLFTLSHSRTTQLGFHSSLKLTKTGASIQGLTTAACIWIVSAIGLAMSAGLYRDGIATTALTMFTLTLPRKIDAKMPKFYSRTLTVLAGISMNEDSLVAVLTKYNVRISNAE